MQLVALMLIMNITMICGIVGIFYLVKTIHDWLHPDKPAEPEETPEEPEEL